MNFKVVGIREPGRIYTDLLDLPLRHFIRAAGQSDSRK